MSSIARSNALPPSTPLALSLRYKYLEQAFYTRGYSTFNATSGTSSDKFTAGEDSIVKAIRDHEAVHVTQLAAALGAGAQAPPPAGQYDWTAGGGTGNGPFPNTMLAKAEFFRVGQLIEDASVRALKGEIPSLFGAATLSMFVRIHSTEGRHAAMMRVLRTPNGPPYDNNAAPWPTPSSINSVVESDFSTAAAVSGTSQYDIALLLYGPKTPPVAHYGDAPAKSLGEDNMVQSSSFAPDAYVNPSNGYDALPWSYAYAFDEPIDATLASTFAAYFGA